MRLQLIAVVGMTLASFEAARAEPDGDHATVVARSSVYADDDHTQILTNTVALHVKPRDEVVVTGHYTADAVSSASVDVITAATERWTERRDELEGGVAFTSSTTTLAGSYVYSHENDWSSHTASLAASRDVLHHNLTLGAGVSYGDNAVGRRDDMTFSERMQVAGGSLRAVWPASRDDIFQITYDLSRVTGYQSSPYRHAFADGPAGASIAVAERVPALRTRHAATLRWNHHMLDNTALRSHMRLYADSWGIASVTTGTELVVGLAALELAASIRAYAQRHAGFYQDIYDMPRQYMTADRELSTFQDVFAGVRARWQHADTLSIDASLSAFAFRFPEFSRLPSRRGVIASVGLVWAL